MAAGVTANYISMHRSGGPWGPLKYRKEPPEGYIEFVYEPLDSHRVVGMLEERSSSYLGWRYQISNFFEVMKRGIMPSTSSRKIMAGNGKHSANFLKGMNQ